MIRAGSSLFFLRCLIIILAGLFVYGQTFHFGFVFDDQYFIAANPFIKSFSQIHLMWHVFPRTRLVGIYSFGLNYYFNQLHPQGYHLFNFLVHLLATGLVWVLADLLFKITQAQEDGLKRELSLLIAVLFLVHPCQTQAVTYISQRFESMACVFYLGTIYFYLRARVSMLGVHKIILFGTSGFLALLGIFTKEVVMTVPVMIFALEWILFPKKANKVLYGGIALGGLLFYVLFSKLLHADLSVFFQSTLSQSHDGETLTPGAYFLTQMRVFLTFLRLFIWPANQNLDYDYPASSGLLHPPLTLMGACVIGFFIFLIIKFYRRFKLIAVGLGWMLITFSINFVPRSNVIFEHKLYLISFGFILCAVSFLALLIRNRAVLLGVLWCMAAVLAVVSFERNKIWSNELSLWNDTVLQSPHKARPYNNRGLAYFDLGRFPEAFADYNKAIEINPNYAESYNNRGLLYYKQGRYAQAIADFNKDIEYNINYPEEYSVYSNRGIAYFQLGNLTQALMDYNRAIEINPYFASSYSNRGLLHYSQGHFSQAIADYNKAIELGSKASDDFNNRGTCFAQQGNLTQAVINYTEAINSDPDNIQAYRNRATAYYMLKEFDKADQDRRHSRLRRVARP